LAHSQFKTAVRRAGLTMLIALAGAYVFLSLRGPYGIAALMEKRHEARSLQERNADLAHQLQEKKDRIRRLRESQAERELEIRKGLKLVRPGETEFIIPEGTKPERPK
jgi:cell division protein FtsB